jgi:hypothetical protein
MAEAVFLSVLVKHQLQDAFIVDRFVLRVLSIGNDATVLALPDITWVTSLISGNFGSKGGRDDGRRSVKCCQQHGVPVRAFSRLFPHDDFVRLITGRVKSPHKILLILILFCAWTRAT